MIQVLTDLRLRAGRRDDHQEIARVHAETWLDAYRDILPLELYPRFSLENRLTLWRGLYQGEEAPMVDVLAMPDGRLAGFAWMRRIEQAEAAFDSEIIAIAVSPAYQRRGLGVRLMAAAARRLKRQRGGSVYVWVYRDNAPARDFYVKLDGRMVDEDTEQVESTQIPIVAYAWKPLDDLLAACAAASGQPA